MNGWKIARAGVGLALLGIVSSLSACAGAPSARQPSARQEASILDVVDRRQAVGPVSCAALGASSICEKSTRLDKGHNCGCADPQAITDGRAFRP